MPQHLDWLVSEMHNAPLLRAFGKHVVSRGIMVEHEDPAAYAQLTCGLIGLQDRIE